MVLLVRWYRICTPAKFFAGVHINCVNTMPLRVDLPQHMCRVRECRHYITTRIHDLNIVYVFPLGCDGFEDVPEYALSPMGVIVPSWPVNGEEEYKPKN